MTAGRRNWPTFLCRKQPWRGTATIPVLRPLPKTGVAEFDREGGGLGFPRALGTELERKGVRGNDCVGRCGRKLSKCCAIAEKKNYVLARYVSVKDTQTFARQYTWESDINQHFGICVCDHRLLCSTNSDYDRKCDR